MSHKKRYPCDILDHIFACNFWMVNAIVMKFGSIVKNFYLQIIMYLFIIFYGFMFIFTLI